jgi:hypothetical protein
LHVSPPGTRAPHVEAPMKQSFAEDPANDTPPGTLA